jgi:hypothetical protein
MLCTAARFGALLASFATLLLTATTASALPPEVTTLAATDVTMTSATLVATVNPQGVEMTVHFEYGLGSALGRRTIEVVIPAGTAPVQTAAPISGLRPGRTYSYEARAETEENDASGGLLTLTTAARTAPVSPPASHLTHLLSDVTQTSLTVNISVTPFDANTTVTIRYGLSGAPATKLGPFAVDQAGHVAIPLTGLTPGTFYRIVASTSGSTEVFSVKTAPLKQPPQLTATPKEVPYGSSTTISGELRQDPGATVTLVSALFSSPLVPLLASTPPVTTLADAASAFSFPVKVTAPMRFGVTVPGYLAPSLAYSVNVSVLPAIDVHIVGLRGRRVRVFGRYVPNLPARVSLKRVGHGLAGKPLRGKSNGDGRTFAFPARRLAPGTYRVSVYLDDRSSGLLQAAVSRVLHVRR